MRARQGKADRPAEKGDSSPRSASNGHTTKKREEKKKTGTPLRNGQSSLRALPEKGGGSGEGKRRCRPNGKGGGNRSLFEAHWGGDRPPSPLAYLTLIEAEKEKPSLSARNQGTILPRPGRETANLLKLILK